MQHRPKSVILLNLAENQFWDIVRLEHFARQNQPHIYWSQNDQYMWVKTGLFDWTEHWNLAYMSQQLGPRSMRVAWRSPRQEEWTSRLGTDRGKIPC